MSIERKNKLGYTSWTVMDMDDNEIVTFDSYYDAVDFLTFMNEV